jgi:mannose-6-phosphate isomerase-like protein (cupin superfamily)
MNSSRSGTHIALRDALAAAPSPGSLAADMFARGSIDVEFYAPRKTDPQKPHTRDELYIVARGSGMLEVEDERYTFVTGDVLFVAAHARHRFVDFSDDFGTWVLFYGPEGGDDEA